MARFSQTEHGTSWDTPEQSGLPTGRLVLWNDEKGFGFVRPDQGGGDLFVHISAFRRRMTRRPVQGDVVKYEVGTDQRKQPCIIFAAIPEADAEDLKEFISRPWLHPFFRKLIIMLPIVLSLYLIWHANNPIPLFAYIFMSMLTILFYGADKRWSMTGHWRMPEVYFHVFAILGGWPGALLAQAEFQHKTKKSVFTRILWGIIALHGAFWLRYLLAASGVTF